MFTPDRKPTSHTGPSTPDAVEVRRAADLAIYTNAKYPTRTTQVVSWIGWHIGELSGLVVPLGLGVAFWDGFYTVSVLTALGWAAHELRVRRQQRATRIRLAEVRAGSAKDGEVTG